jgi:divalent metal cation (Fe/Co/Zn/Cd) transporter
MAAVTLDPHGGGVPQAPPARVPTLVQVALFFMITFAATWAAFLPLVLRVLSPQEGWGALLQAPGVAAPSLTAFVLTALAGAVILLTGFHRADGIASLATAAIMLHSAYGLLRASGRIFLEAAPEGVDPSAIGEALAGQPEVVEVHDLHVWEVTSGFQALSAHVVVSPGCDCHEVRRQLEEVLAQRFGLHHTTLQVDHERSGELLHIEAPGQPAR